MYGLCSIVFRRCLAVNQHRNQNWWCPEIISLFSLLSLSVSQSVCLSVSSSDAVLKDGKENSRWLVWSVEDTVVTVSKDSLWCLSSPPENVPLTLDGLCLSQLCCPRGSGQSSSADGYNSVKRTPVCGHTSQLVLGF